MKKIFTLNLAILLTLPAFAQLSRSLVECANLDYPYKYNDAEAVIIEEVGNIRFREKAHGGFEYVFQRQMQFKINNSSGIHWSEFEIPLYRDERKGEYLEKVKVKTFEPGGIVKVYGMKDLDIYTEKYGKNGVYEKFAIPGVKEGSFIEVDYSYHSPYLFGLDDWVFQYSIPVLSSKVKIAVIPYYEYALLKRGPNRLSYSNSIESPIEKRFGTNIYRERIYIFSMNNIPAFEDESFITSRRDYIDRLEFQLARIHRTNGTIEEVMTSWPLVIKELKSHQRFGKYISAANKHAKGQLKGLGKLPIETESMVNFITSHVKSTLAWNGDNRTHASGKIKQISELREGSSAEVNLYLVGALRAAGLEAYPLLISTRNHGKIYRDRPLIGNFNYVIAAVPHEGGYLLRDATDASYPPDQLPIRCLNGQGLLVKEDSEVWIDAGIGIEESQVQSLISLQPLPEEGRLNLEADIRGSGYDAVIMTRRIDDDEEKLEEMLESELLAGADSVSIDSNTGRRDSIRVKIYNTADLANAGGIIFIPPFAGLPEKECPLKSKNRNYPVDMIYSKQRIYSSEISIPEGYKLSYIPDAYRFSNELIDLNYQWTNNGSGTLKVEARLHFKKRIYPPSDYKKLRYFYDDMIKRINENITLEPG